MTDAVFVDREAIHKPHAFAAQRTRDGKLVVTERGRRRLEAGSKLDRGVNTDADRDRQRTPKLLGFFVEGADVACAGNHVNGDLIRALQA